MSGAPFTVKAIFDYTSDHDDDLNFAIGQIITVTEEEDADWYYGEYPDESGSKRQGIFPRNFVERYEPAAPPRPMRPSRVKKEPESIPQMEPVELDAGEMEAPVNSRVSRNIFPPPPPPAAEVSAPEESAPPKQPAAPPPPPALAEPVQKPAAKPPPAAMTKPVSSAFKDRIAAFNKTTAPPIAPFKSGGLPSQNPNTFIRKQFVAPPPSKDAYVIQPREPAPKIYRREEDPEIVDYVNREPPVSESRPATNESAPETGEDQPKPTSLKERIALLHKQQLEQAARHAEAIQKKEKPKKPPKKRLDSHEQLSVLAEGPDLEKIDGPEAARDHTAEAAEEANRSRPAPAVPPVLSPLQPSQELVSDTNDADHSGAGDTEDAEETSTSREDYEHRPPARSHSKDDALDNDEQEGVGEDGAGEEEEEEVDPEVKRKQELRERMAKMSGGIGMIGMFGPPPGGMRVGARKPDIGRKPSDDSERVSSPVHAPPVSIMALPGINARRPPELVSSPKEVEREEKELHHNSVAQLHIPDEVSDAEGAGCRDDPSPQISTERPPPPPPQERPAPDPRPVPPRVPSVPTQTVPAPPALEIRPVPPPPISPPVSLSPGEDSDDELSTHTTTKSLNAITSGTVAPTLPPPLPPHVIDQSESSPPLRRSSTYDSTSLKSPAPGLERRLSRGPPPIPGNPPQQSPPLIRPPPPPPPALPSRQFTSDGRTGSSLPAVQPEEDTEGEVTEYDGDYDTDITPGAKFKDALKAHERDSSLDDDVPLHPPRGPENRPPPPLPTAPRAVPPPPPNQPPKSHRLSTLPPPIPLPKEHIDDNEYDYDRHGASPPLPLPPTGRPTPHLPAQQQSPQDGLYDVSPVHSQPHPPPPPPERMAAAPLPRSSLDVSRGPGNARKSIDISRPSVDQSFIATDIDLAQGGMWWTQPNSPPPIFQNRKDIFYEVEESSLSKRGGKTTISKSVYILFMDYSQTIINVRFDARNPVDVVLEQRHEPPPNRPRQDQLESAHIQFGSRISEAVNAIQNTTVADGTPHSLIQHLVSPLTDALLPVGTRAYGALVYANLANASVQQHDEIRAGDIVSFRNARFQGHRGTMHQKYHVEVGKPDHVGIVVDWDGTKKKIHSWEQGRESRKVKTESFKLGDLKSGECKVWRVMPRSWVRWERSKE